MLGGPAGGVIQQKDGKTKKEADFKSASDVVYGNKIRNMKTPLIGDRQ